MRKAGFRLKALLIYEQTDATLIKFTNGKVAALKDAQQA
jgi:hypothetical protein